MALQHRKNGELNGSVDWNGDTIIIPRTYCEDSQINNKHERRKWEKWWKNSIGLNIRFIAERTSKGTFKRNEKKHINFEPNAVPLKCQRNRFGISKQQIELWSSISACLWCTYTGLFEWSLFRALYLSHSFSRWHRTGTNGNRMLNMLNMHHISCYTWAEEDATFVFFRNLICRYSNEHCDRLYPIWYFNYCTVEHIRDFDGN